MKYNAYYYKNCVTFASILLFSLGFFLPFANQGPHVAGSIYITPGLVIGVIAPIYILVKRGIGLRFAYLLLMIIIFFILTFLRYPLESFYLSLSALFLLLLILVVRMPHEYEINALFIGFQVGLAVVVFIIFVEIFSQIIGADSVYLGVQRFFSDQRTIQNAHNHMVFYYRPYATFAEPAHLAYYLAFSYATLDQVRSSGRSWLKYLTLLAIFLSGSMVGYVLLLVYLVSKKSSIVHNYGLMNLRLNIVKTLESLLLFSLLTILILFVFLYSDFFQTISERLVGRLSQVYEALIGHNVGSSAGVRAGSWIVLLDYWRSNEFGAFLVGTGYANYDTYMMEYYRDSPYSTWASGKLHSSAVVVLLSTGLVGSLSYLLFMFSVFRYFRQDKNLAVVTLVLFAHFASGALLSYVQWQIMFVLLLARNFNLRKYN